MLSILDETIPKFRKYDIHAILNAIFYLVKTGCQWNMLPPCFPHWKTVYHHFRSLSEKGVFSKALISLVSGYRGALGEHIHPCVAVLDSESVRSGLIHSCKGVDGYKKIKGIKRQILTDTHGYPLMVHTTTANVNDSKGAVPLLGNANISFPALKEIKADKGYRGCGKIINDMGIEINVRCVKSNYGTSDFQPLEGRWVVERTISWMSNYRRLNRNYEKLLSTARNIYIVGCIVFMLRYFK